MPLGYPERHYLFIGRSGQGKSTWLLRLFQAASQLPQNPQAISSILIRENSFGITHLHHLWEHCFAQLARIHPLFAKKLQAVQAKLNGSIRHYERLVYHELNEALRESQQKLLLFVDDLGRILSRFSKEEVGLFAERLKHSLEIRIIACTDSHRAQIFEQEDSMGALFKRDYLRDLSEADTFQLFSQLSEVNKSQRVSTILNEQPERIETLRRMTGGCLRNLIQLFRILKNQKGGDTFQDFITLLAQESPTLKHHIEDLSVQQQQIVHYMGRQLEAISTKQLAQATQLASKKVSAQLRQLEKSGIVISIPTHTKNHLYQLQNRLFNYWYWAWHTEDPESLTLTLEFIQLWIRDKKARPLLLGDQFDQMEQSALSAIAAGKREAMLDLGELYFSQRKSEKKHNALTFAEAAYHQNKPWHTAFVLASIYLWHNRIGDALKLANRVVYNTERIQNDPIRITEFLMLLIAKDQSWVVYEIFSRGEGIRLKLKDRLKPLWYALMYFMQEEHPSEYLKMGPELKETVEEIIARVEEMRKQYK